MRIADLDITAFIERLTDNVLLVATDGRLLDANAASLKSYGYTIEQLRELLISDLRAPEQRAAIPAQLQRAITGEVTFEAVHLRADGTTFPVEINSTRVSVNGENALLSIVKDLSARKSAELAAAEREIRYSTLAKYAEDWVFLASPDGRYDYISPSCERITGYSPEDLIADPDLLIRIMHVDDRTSFEEHLSTVDDGPVYRAQFRIIRPDGEVRWIEHVCASAHAEDGTWIGRVGSNRDITARVADQQRILELQQQRAATELKTTEKILELFVEHAPAAIAMFDTDMRYLAVSRRFLNDYGIGEESVVGRSHYDVFPEIGDDWKQVHRECLAGASLSRADDEFPRADGTTDWVAWEIRPWYREDDSIGGIVLFSEVVTERHRATQELAATNARLQSVLTSITEMVGRIVETKDPYTKGHEQRVARLSVLLATEMGLDEHETDGIEVAATLHDVGKLAIPAEILSKPGTLLPLEVKLIRMHPQAGYDILKDIDFSWPVADIVMQHHERMDGSGYPAGLAGEDILLQSRVLMVADVLEAMSAHRPYRPAAGIDAAIAEVTGHPEWFDERIVAAAVRLYERGVLQEALA